MLICGKKNRPSSIAHRQSSGFTLIELTAVAGLIALLSAAAFISYAQSWRHSALRQNAQQFFLAARYARVRAIESGQTCRLVIDRTNRTFFVAQDDADTGETTQVSNLWNRPAQLADSVAFERVAVAAQMTAAESPTDSETIAFRPDGSADGATVQLGNGTARYTVQISAATGRAALYEPEEDAAQTDRIDLDQTL